MKKCSCSSICHITIPLLYKYEVLIASDGKDYFQYGRIGRVVDELIDAEEIENVIVVGVPYKSV